MIQIYYTMLADLRICILSSEDILDFFNKTISDFPEFENADFRCKYADKLANNAEFVVAFDDDGEVVAMIAAYLNRPPLAYISHFCIMIQYRGIGLSKTMLSFLEICASQRGCSYIKLEVKKKNRVAYSLYEGFGFVEEGAASENSFYMGKVVGLKMSGNHLNEDIH